MFYSTRNKTRRETASVCILKGLASDGGLYLPETIPTISYQDLIGKEYPEAASEILKPYLDDFTEEEIKRAARLAYDKTHFLERIFDIHNGKSISFLELYHGLTLTFKDMALSLFPYLLKIAESKHPQTKPLHILTATSGDTGSAVLSAFSKTNSVNVSILYPDNGIFPIQEKQMLYFTSAYSRAYALKDSNFDQCQSLVKELLVKGSRNETFTSANSINIGRLLPQIVYYYESYIRLMQTGVIRENEKIDIIVPTGNFGDILAGYLAKKMSLPIGRLVIASNENRILTDFLETGVYDLKRDFIKTNSPSMDILISSNLERLLSLIIDDDRRVSRLMDDLKKKGKFLLEEDELKEIQKSFLAESCDQEETENAILDCYQKEKYLIDPHTAVAYGCYQKMALSNHILILSTASPLKFPSTILKSLHIENTSGQDDFSLLVRTLRIDVPEHLRKTLDEKTEKEVIDQNRFIDIVSNRKNYTIKTCATSANLGPGFDVMGIALDLFNIYSFHKNNKDVLLGFDDEYNNQNNLILKSYQYAFRKRNLPYQPICITQKEENIPPSRGLGSSSSCIITGLRMANEILNHLYCQEELYEMACEIEGHPDNIGACLFSGLVVNLKNENGEHIPLRLKPSKKYSYVLVIPETRTSTEEARKALPDSYKREDVIYNLSHIPGVLISLKEGNEELLFASLKDKIHIPYRKKLIPEYEKLEEISYRLRIPFTISGSGSTCIYVVLDEKKETLISELEKNTHSKILAQKALLKQTDIQEEEIIDEK